VIAFVLIFALGVLQAHAGGSSPPMNAHTEIEKCSGSKKGSSRQQSIAEVSCGYEYFLPKSCEGEANQCAKDLVLYFALTSNCSSEIRSKAINDGKIFVCSKIFEGDSNQFKYPHLMAAPRIAKLISSITANPVIKSAWIKSRLLYTGDVLGGHALMVTMSITDYDELDEWKGRSATRVCLFDPVSDVRDSLSFLYRNGCHKKGDAEKSLMQDLLRRYGSEIGNIAETPDMKVDSVLLRSATDFSTHRWKMIECGSAQTLNRCIEDVFPANGVRDLCTKINKQVGYRCDFASIKSQASFECGQKNTACLDWFDQK